MADFFSLIDAAIFHFFNSTLSNPVCDVVMPALTDWNQSWIGLSIFGGGFLLFLWKGGRKARIIGLLMMALILFADQFSSHLLKPLFARARPCHVVDGVRVVEHVRLLVNCGSGFSFPSSHAVNNFAIAVFLAHYYRRWRWVFLVYAVLMAMSRVIIGVHFPSDVTGGALIGAGAAFPFIWMAKLVGNAYPGWRIEDERNSASREAS